MLTKACNRFCMNSGAKLVFGHKTDKVWKFRDDFELQLGGEETHCAKISLPQADNAVKGALSNNSSMTTYEVVKHYSLHQTVVYPLKCLNWSVKFTAFLSSFLQLEIQEGKLSFWL